METPMSEIPSYQSYQIDILYRDFVLFSQTELRMLLSGELFAPTNAPMPVGTLIKLAAEPNEAGERRTLPAYVIQVAEATSQAHEPGMVLQIPEGGDIFDLLGGEV